MPAVATKKKRKRKKPLPFWHRELGPIGWQFLRRVSKNKIRPIGTFAEDEIIVPRGKYAGRYKVDRKPASRLWFNEIESGRWITHIYTGPVQSGKTLDAFIIPIMWCLFEKEEDVIVGIPDMNLSRAKWQKDILPMIKASRFRNLLPQRGQGSRGGDIKEITFLNGCSLIFMSFGGSDKSRASETAPNLIVTETDGANEVSETSDEGTYIDQLIGRTMSYDDEAFIVMECTLSTEQGITWQEYTKGSAAKTFKWCPYCKKYCTPEREHFHGWKSAETETKAGESGFFHCNKCGERWTDDDRRKAIQKTRLVHRGQTISSDGKIAGRLPETTTLGFRVAAVDNIFRSSKYLAQLCWKTARREDAELAQRTLLQQQFAEPWRENDDEEPRLDPYTTQLRVIGAKRNIVPDGYDRISVGTDLRATQMHSVVGAWQPNGTPHIVNYGIGKVRSREIGRERAILESLRTYRDKFLAGGFQDSDGNRVDVGQWWIDAGWQTKTVYRFIRESWKNERWKNVIFAYLGRGNGKQYSSTGTYTHPEKKTKLIHEIGDQFYLKWDIEEQCYKIFVNADHHKSHIHAHLRIPVHVPGEDKKPTAEINPGAMTLFDPDDGDHSGYVKQILAEYEKEIFVANKKAPVKVFIVESRVNHFLDATYAMRAASFRLGVRPTDEVNEQKNIAANNYQRQEAPTDTGLVMPDGRVMTY